jgi:hypothetical protein
MAFPTAPVPTSFGPCRRIAPAPVAMKKTAPPRCSRCPFNNNFAIDQPLLQGSRPTLHPGIDPNIGTKASMDINPIQLGLIKDGIMLRLYVWGTVNYNDAFGNADIPLFVSIFSVLANIHDLGISSRRKLELGILRKPAECENPKCRHQLFQAQASAIGIHHRLRHREHLSRQRMQRSALLGGPVVAPVDAGNATAAAADVVQHRFCHFEPKLFQAWCERSVGSLRPSLHKNAETSSAMSAMFKHDRNPLQV